MDEIFEMIFYGRGGQGIKTASQLAADSLIEEGYYIQAFPEYGPERAGAPVKAYTRISKKPIRIHCSVEKAHIGIIVDPTLIGTIDMTSNIKKDGILLVNSKLDLKILKEKLNFSGKIFAIDATKISEEIIGRNLPNMAMLGVLSKHYPVLKLSFLKNQIKKKFTAKLGELGVKKNILILERGFNEA